MTILVITPPAAEPVSLDEMKAHLNVTIEEDDELIEAKIAAARAHIERFAGIAMVTQTLKLTLDRFPTAAIALPRPPLLEVVSVAYVDAQQAPQTLAGGAYTVRGVGATGYLVPPSTWPSTAAGPAVVEITFSAGYGETASAVPEPLREAVKLLAAHLYENREATFVGTGGASILPLGVEDLVAEFRQWGFG